MLPELLNGLGQASIGPDKTPFSGTHYAKEKIKGGVLHGDKRGMTQEGEDSDRVYLPPRGAPAGVHVYENNGQVFGKHPQVLARPHAYSVNGAYALADIDTEPLWAQAKQEVMLNTQGKMPPDQAELVARNEAEWKLKEAGYDGYRSSSTPGNVLLFGDHPAQEVGKIDPNAPPASQATPPQEDLDAQSNMDGVSDQNPPMPVDNPVGTFATPHKVPLTGPDEHEEHAAGSDPANLASRPS